MLSIWYNDSPQNPQNAGQFCCDHVTNGGSHACDVYSAQSGILSMQMLSPRQPTINAFKYNYMYKVFQTVKVAL